MGQSATVEASRHLETETFAGICRCAPLARTLLQLLTMTPQYANVGWTWPTRVPYSDPPPMIYPEPRVDARDIPKVSVLPPLSALAAAILFVGAVGALMLRSTALSHPLDADTPAAGDVTPVEVAAASFRGVVAPGGNALGGALPAEAEVAREELEEGPASLESGAEDYALTPEEIEFRRQRYQQWLADQGYEPIPVDEDPEAWDGP